MKTLIGMLATELCIALPFIVIFGVYVMEKKFMILDTSGSSKQMFASIIKKRRQIDRESMAPVRATDEQIQRARERMVESIK